MEKRALQLASVASMIDLFNRDNIRILQELGYRVDVATNFEEGSITSQEHVDNYRKELAEQGIDAYQIPIPRSPKRVIDIIKSYMLVKKLVEQKQYQIVHCHSPIGGVICRLACRKARKKGTKVIYTAHGFHFFKGSSLLSWILFYPLEKMCSRFTDVLITINSEDNLRAQKMHAKKVVNIPGIGVHTERFARKTVDVKTKRNELGFDINDFVFMSTGQLSQRKNHRTVIKALSLLDDPRCKYLLVGFGEEEENLKLLVEELKLDNQVTFAGYREDVNELLSISDAFVFPSLQEGLPVSLMEAMATGLPVVCSNVRGNRDLIIDGLGGYLYAPDDYKGFSIGMKNLKNTEKLFAMGTYNKARIKEFDSTIVNNEMKDLYLNI